MKEKPIIFTAPMVRAILEGRKTQTRRIMKIQPPDEGYQLATCVSTTGPKREIGQHHWVKIEGDGFKYADGRQPYFSCPYSVGQIAWVRENWRIGAWDENKPAFALDYCDGPRKEWVDVPDPGCDDGELFNRLWQQSTDDANNAGVFADDDGVFRWEPGQSPCRWRPSIFMPRWASRINLEITGVRVERVQDISEDDAIAEGVDFGHITDHLTGEIDCEATDAYENLWEQINGPGSWDKNPWVWVIEFKRV